MKRDEEMEPQILISRVQFRRLEYQKQIDQAVNAVQNEVRIIQEAEQRLAGLRQRLTATQGAAAGLDEIISAPDTYGVDVKSQNQSEKPMEV